MNNKEHKRNENSRPKGIAIGKKTGSFIFGSVVGLIALEYRTEPINYNTLEVMLETAHQEALKNINTNMSP